MDIPKGKQTVLGLYVTAREAYEMWRADPDKVFILDVRTPEEYGFVGHAEKARNIPLGFVKHRWDDAKNAPVFEPNSRFIESVQQHYKHGDTILVTCRSGGRAAAAVDAMAAIGFRAVYNIVDGMEGDMEKDPSSVFCGQRMKNGWKNAGAPWTYKLNRDLLWLET
ncbi:sulfurtransferase [Phaeobacter gallaeciensis]|uniref:Sulfurtransferase n=1 Tax=Phaeobacter gallaeciensis TaxID=60890 RepID=A0A366X771_9RHOB|nr:sulfurtransferase [Phaeobacter gallaeciensis]